MTHSEPKTKKGIILTDLSSTMTTVPLRVDLAVFRLSLKVLLKARWMGITALMIGIKRPIATASRVATNPGTIETPSDVKSSLLYNR